MENKEVSKEIQALKESLPRIIQKGLDSIMSNKSGSSNAPDSLNKFIDHTLLKPTATRQQVIELCRQAKTYNFYSVCIPSYFLTTAKEVLDGTEVKLCTVIGFPLGNCSLIAKIEEAKKALLMGAEEIDMVQNNGAFFSNKLEDMFYEVREIKAIAKTKTLKVILETGFLNHQEIILSSLIAKAAGADFIKTSTGFGPRGASVEDITLMSTCAEGAIGVKASGGIRTQEQAKKMIAAGATRLGCSASVEIIKGLEGQGQY